MPDPFSRCRQPPVPDGGPGALPAGRRPRLPGPARPPGEGARLPHRAGRGRGGAAPAAGGGGGGGAGARRRGARPPGGLVVTRRDAVGPARGAAGAAAGVHGADGLACARSAAADAERQGGPQGAAASRPGSAPAAGYVEPRSPLERRWRPSSPRCWGWTAWVPTRASSRSAATRSSPPGCCRGCGRSSASSCRCAPSSSARRWRPSPGASRPPAGDESPEPPLAPRSRDGGRPPLLRPAAAVVPRPARSRHRLYNMPAGLPAARPLAAAPAGCPGRGRAPPRGAAHDASRCAGASPRRSIAPPGRVPSPWLTSRACRPPARRRRLPAGAGGGAAALRPRRGAAAAHYAAPARRRGAPAAARPAPHRLATAGRWSLLAREIAAPLRAPSPPACRRRCPRCRCSMPISPLWQRELARRRRAGGAARLLARAARPGCRRRSTCRPTGRGRRSRASAAARRSSTCPRSWPRGLQRAGRRRGATLFMTLLAAFQPCSAATPAATDLRVGTPVASRNRAELEGLIGFFVNTLVLRADLAGDPALRGAARPGAGDGPGAYAHQDLPFERLVERAGSPSATSPAPRCSRRCSSSRTPRRPRLELRPASRSRPSRPPARTRRSSISPWPWPVSGDRDGLTATAEYRTDLFDAATIRRLLAHFQRPARGGRRGPGRPASPTCRC